LGYARISTNEQDLTAQRNAPFGWVPPEGPIYFDNG
jgi:hypothetical protein